jgi:hypothetical protein
MQKKRESNTKQDFINHVPRMDSGMKLVTTQEKEE